MPHLRGPWFHEKLSSLHEVTLTLSRERSHDDLCRRAVALGREQLDFDRLGIWFLEAERKLVGSFGTDEAGRLRDERDQSFEVRPGTILASMLEGRVSQLVRRDTDLFGDLAAGVVGRGDRALAPMWDGERIIGFVATDNLLHQKPISDEQIELLRLFAGTMGHLCSRLRMEESLRESEERFRELAEHSREVFWLADSSDGRFLYVSPAFERIWGRSSEILRDDPASFVETVHPDDRAALFSIWERQARGEETDDEFRIVRPDGGIRWIRNRGRPIRDAAGHMRRISGISEDVSARRRAEQRDRAFLRLGQALNSAATPEHSARIIVETADDLIGWDACWLNTVNAELTCCNPVVEIDVIEGRRSEVAPAVTELSASSLAVRSFREGPLLILRRPEELTDAPCIPYGDRSRRSASLMCVPIRSGSHPIGALSIQSYAFDAYDAEDLTLLQALADYCAGALERTQAEADRRQLESQLRQAHKMEAVGRLAGGVAHDFNNMLVVITGYTELLLQDATVPASAREALGEIRKAGERAAAVTRQLLAFSQQQIIVPELVDLSQTVRELERTLQPIVGDGVDLATELCPEPALVRMDPGQLHQLLLNLALNARDAMPEGGQLHIGVAPVRLERGTAGFPDDVPPGEYVRLCVRDSGPGIPEPEQTHVFDPFFTTKAVGQGVGLGLSTVYGIVQQNGGQIHLESGPGKGSRFCIYLPRQVDD